MNETADQLTRGTRVRMRAWPEDGAGTVLDHDDRRVREARREWQGQRTSHRVPVLWDPVPQDTGPAVGFPLPGELERALPAHRRG
jgi:hypothetical protein